MNSLLTGGTYDGPRENNATNALEVFNALAGQVATIEKWGRANEAAGRIAREELANRPVGATTIVRLTEVGARPGEDLPGEFSVYKEVTANSNDLALKEWVSSDYLRPEGNTLAVWRMVKTDENNFELRYLSREEVEAAASICYSAESIARQESYTREANAAAEQKREQEANELRARAAQEQRDREQTQRAIEERRELSERASRGDKEAGRQLSNEIDDFDRRSRTAMVSPHAEDRPSRIPPWLAPYVLGTDPRIVATFPLANQTRFRDGLADQRDVFFKPVEQVQLEKRPLAESVKLAEKLGKDYTRAREK